MARTVAPSRIAAVLVALVAWVGLAVQVRASIGVTGALAPALWAMLRYFTVLANLLVAGVFTQEAAGRHMRARTLGGLTIAILLVGAVYALLLRGLLELSGGAALADLLLHRVTPVLVPLWWLAFAPRGLTWRDPLVWALLPLGYFAYGLVRGALEGVYPYPFMNVARIGWPAVLAYAATMAAGFFITGFALVGLARLLRR